MYGDRARQLGWTPAPGQVDDARSLRQQLVALVARDGEDPELIAEAQKLALRWLDDRKAVDAQMAGPVIYVAAAHGGQELFDRIHAAALKTQDRREREILLSAMGSFRDPAIVKQRLALLLTDEFDLREAFSPLLFPAPRDAPRLPFEFVMRNLDALLKKLPREVGGDYAADLPRVGDNFCDAPAATISRLLQAAGKPIRGRPAQPCPDAGRHRFVHRQEAGAGPRSGGVSEELLKPPNG